jgi:hypothetical protein
MATDFHGGAREAIVNSELFPGMDAAAAEVKDVAADSAGEEIGVTTVVDEFGAAATHGAIHELAAIEVENADPAGAARTPDAGEPSACFFAADALAGVLDYLAARRDNLCREDAGLVDERAADAQAEARETRVYAVRRHNKQKKGPAHRPGVPLELG